MLRVLDHTARYAFQVARSVAPSEVSALPIVHAGLAAIIARRLVPFDVAAEKIAVKIPENRSATAPFPGIRRSDRQRQQNG